LAEIGKRLGVTPAQVASVAKPATILAWYRKLIAHKFDSSQYRSYPGRPRIEPKLEALIVQMAKANSVWGVRSHCGRAGQSRLQNLRSERRECSEAPQDCAGAEAEPNHDLEGIYSIAVAVLAGIDFFTVEVLT
jgi:hypothetical protein